MAGAAVGRLRNSRYHGTSAARLRRSCADVCGRALLALAAPDMSTFHLIRHGERAIAEDMLVGRAPGVPLTERGRRQAQAVAAALAPLPPRLVASSPLERAHATAEPLAAACGLSVELADGIHEVDYGEWTNRPVRELDELEVWRAFNRSRSLGRAPGGESLRDVQSRFVDSMLRWSEEYPDAHVALVSHADPIRTALVYFAGLSLDLLDRWVIDFGSITTIEVHSWGARIVRVNRVPELPA